MKKTKTLVAVILGCVMMLSACGSSPKHSVTVTDQQFETVNEHKMVAVYADYTNGSDKSALPCDEVKVEAFQNGVALSPIVFTGEKHGEYIQCDTSVQGGVTAKVVWLFETDDFESEVTVEAEAR